jgi:hypothetical protein
LKRELCELKKNATTLLTLCGAGAQLSWLYAWACFLLFSLFDRLYPLPETIGVFGLAALITRIRHRFGWRGIQIIGAHLTGLAIFASWVVYVFYYHSEPFWSRGWLIDFFNRTRDQIGWLLLVFVLCDTIIFWLAGICFASRTKSYVAACTRFDRGVSAFFCLFLLKLVLHTRMAVQFHDSMTVYLIFPFFIFSLTEIGLARNQDNIRQIDYLPGHYAFGVFATFSIGALIIGTSIFMFFLPYLTAASAVGYDLMKGAAGSLEPIIIAVIRFIFGYAKSGPQDPGLLAGIEPEAAAGASEPGAMMVLFQKILILGAWTLLIAAGLVIVGYGSWYFLRWLFKKPYEGEPFGDFWTFSAFWMRLKALLENCFQRISFAKKPNTALQYFAALQRWGRNSGFRQRPAETPMEYGNRLVQHFPRLNAEITLIIKMLHREAYGEVALFSEQIMSVRQAWRKLHSPLMWSYRLKSLMTH